MPGPFVLDGTLSDDLERADRVRLLYEMADRASGTERQRLFAEAARIKAGGAASRKPPMQPFAAPPDPALLSAPTVPEAGGLMAIDVGLMTGWAIGGLTGLPRLGAWMLPDPGCMGSRIVALENELDDALALHRPSVIGIAARIVTVQTSAELLTYLTGAVVACAYRAGARLEKIAESTARKDVLGRGTFGDRDGCGKVIKGTGTAHAKRAALAWCDSQGIRVPTLNGVRVHDAADAAVCLEWLRRRESARAGQGAP